MDTYLEYAAVITGAIYVVLAARSITWCWPTGIISSALYIYINIHQHFYQDAILQTYYVAAGFYGWWHWHRKELHEETDFLSYSLRQNGALILLGVIVVPAFGFVFSHFGNSLSYFDASVTVFSFIATWMTAKKIVQSWLFWIAIDIVATVMYYVKGLHPTSGLYIFYTLMSVYGYYEWRKQMKLA